MIRRDSLHFQRETCNESLRSCARLALLTGSPVSKEMRDERQTTRTLPHVRYAHAIPATAATRTPPIWWYPLAKAWRNCSNCRRLFSRLALSPTWTVSRLCQWRGDAFLIQRYFAGGNEPSKSSSRELKSLQRRSSLVSRVDTSDSWARSSDSRARRPDNRLISWLRNS